MTSSVATKIGRKLFAKHVQQYEPADPLYENYTDERGRQRKRKREIPPGLAPRDAKILRSVNSRAHYLDKGFSICGMRFGWTFIIGIIPGAGDVANAALNYILVVRKAKKADIPGWLLRRMLLNNAIAASVGLVPIVGDIMIAVFKTNSRNAALLEEFLRIRGIEVLKEAEQLAAVSANHSANFTSEHGEKSPQKRQGSGWFARRGKGKGNPTAANARPSMSGSRDSRFIEDVPS